MDDGISLRDLVFFSRVVQVNETACIEFTSLGSAAIILFVLLVGPSISYFCRFVS